MVDEELLSMKKKLLSLTLALSMLLGSGSLIQISAEEMDDPAYNFDMPEENMRMDLEMLNENEEYVEIEMEMYKENRELAEKEEKTSRIQTFAAKPLAAFQPSLGIVILNPEPTDGKLRSATHDIFDSYNGKKVTYISDDAYYTGDMAVLEEKGNRYRIVISGMDGWINKSAIKIVPVDKVLSSSHYYVDGDEDLVHWLGSDPSKSEVKTTALHLGNAPSYLERGIDYLSYDGHYFYTDLKVMLKDYVKGIRTNSVNSNNPFYNYFQFLSYRTESNKNAIDFDNHLKRYGYTSSKISALVGNSNEFIKQMELYGNNAALTFGTAIIESGWGKSKFSKPPYNNLFGHEAFDSMPGNATQYKSSDESIRSHNTYFLNAKYLNYNASLYDGSMLGNKESGLNMWYSADPYWGEKIANTYHFLDDYYGKKDYEQYKIGVTNEKQIVNLRKEPTSKSALVSRFHLKNQAFVIYESVKGETISGSNLWYKISSDHILDKNRDVVKIDSAKPTTLKYDFKNNYVYVHSSLVSVANEVRSQAPKPKPPAFIKGDVDGVNGVEMWDAILIYNHVVGKKTLTSDELKRADVDGENGVEMWDAILVYNHVVGKGTLR